MNCTALLTRRDDIISLSLSLFLGAALAPAKHPELSTQHLRSDNKIFFIIIIIMIMIMIEDGRCLVFL